MRNLILFFIPGWISVSFMDSLEEVILKDKNLDQLSFSHNGGNGHLMLKVPYAPGIKNDTTILDAVKKMVDHTLRNGV
jgi:hypothetical protein